MVYFTADLHFYHDNIIRHVNRPFHSAEEMNRVLVQNWNARVLPYDEVYILGDVTMKGPELAQAVLSRLCGKKYLLRGNHDGFVDRAGFDCTRYFEWVRDYAEIDYANTHFVLFHYPLAEWNGFYKGTIHLHGHQHNRADYNEMQRFNRILRYDAGVDANHMAPVSATEILTFFSGVATLEDRR